ncbi:hypothetical protein GpartN1_g2731.t1 [Galdieria partita]|uniref:Uncharacterized protein n=1 Tax=Galdieria partita TaxID=83374 RepID=A0A9C7PUW4_9RHOD|nr:hypothetical protein GpartN1_g2731.t1 [Galdieria partita]
MIDQPDSLSHWFRKTPLVNSSRCSCETVQLYENETFPVPELKDRSNALYKQGRLLEAEQLYMLAIRQIEDTRKVPSTSSDPTIFLRDEDRSTLQVLYSNLSQTRILLEKFQDAERDAKKAIDLYQKGSCSKKVLVKSFLRRSSAFLGLLQFDSALASLEQVQKLEPNNTECNKLYSQVTKALVEHGSNLRSNYEQNSQRDVLDFSHRLFSSVLVDGQPKEYFSSQISKTASKPCALIQELSSQDDNQEEPNDK